jgi:hypothetical protein
MPSEEQLTVTVDIETLNFLNGIAKENGMAASDVAAELIEQGIRQWQKDLEAVTLLQEMEVLSQTDPYLRFC